ncbi:gas vesicle protein GvpJ [Sinomonas terrae]|uniref:gas vesicle protein GvpJ n=1 Tax=Sinomonas terrae TaxID=2908838 RepID=UPI0025B6DD6D|nr:gas vesicle protein GvpJ [Sinomonas terrae]
MSSEGESSEGRQSVPSAGESSSARNTPRETGSARESGSPRETASASGARSDVVPYSTRGQASAPYPQRPASRQPLQPERSREGTLEHVIETLLDKGLVINADITVSLAGVELLGIRIRAALASLETAARYGLDFPMGTNRNTSAWDNAMEQKETCPQCGKSAPVDQLLYEFCPWCGWRSALALQGGGGQTPDGGGQPNKPRQRRVAKGDDGDGTEG